MSKKELQKTWDTALIFAFYNDKHMMAVAYELCKVHFPDLIDNKYRVGKKGLDKLLTLDLRRCLDVNGKGEPLTAFGKARQFIFKRSPKMAAALTLSKERSYISLKGFKWRKQLINKAKRKTYKASYNDVHSKYKLARLRVSVRERDHSTSWNVTK